MKIATFNINNVIRRLPNLLEWLRAAQPDVVCLQELKAADASFPEAAIRDCGYDAVWRGQRSWNGVAILARGRKPIVVRDELPGDPDDTQSRYIEAAVGGVLVGCIYLPNGNPQPGPKFDYKLAWFERLIAPCGRASGAGVPAVLAGDYNVVPTDRDIYPTRSWAKDALLQPASRAAFARLLDQGWTDAIRSLHPVAPMYTFWDYKRERWRRDAGLRLDHLLLSAPLVGRLTPPGSIATSAGTRARAITHPPGSSSADGGPDARRSACAPERRFPRAEAGSRAGVRPPWSLRARRPGRCRPRRPGMEPPPPAPPAAGAAANRSRHSSTRERGGFEVARMGFASARA